MDWLTHIYLLTAVACVTLALVHLLVWAKQPAGRAHLAFFLTAISLSAITPFEWLMASAKTTEQFGTALRWTQIPVSLAVVSLVWFVWLYFGTGRRWLAIAVCATRVLAMLLSFVFSPNLNYRKITELRQVALFGEKTASSPVGVVNPWVIIGQLSSLLLLAYVVDASIRLWRKGGGDSRRRAAVLGSAAAFFVIAAAGLSAAINVGLVALPVFISLAFLPVVLAMSYELSLDVVQAARLSLEVKANEERLELAQEAGDIGTFDWDIRTGKVIWNEKLESIYGLPAGGFGGAFENWRDRIHSDDLSKCEATIDETITEKRSSWEMEYRMFRADTGHMRWIDARAHFFFDAHGEPVRMLGVNMDITDRKLGEAALRDSQLKLSGLVSSAMDAIISIDDSQRIILFNAAAENMFGYSAREAMGQSVKLLIPERFRKAHREHVREFGETKVTKRKMGRLEPIYGRRADGTEFPIEASISQAETNGEHYFTVIMRDVTERKRAQEALQVSEARFRTMADTAPVLIWMSGADKMCTYFNQGWLDFTGRTMDQELGNGWAEGVHADDFVRCLDVYDLAFDHHKPFKMEYRLRNASGVYRWVYDCGTPRFSATGEFLGYIGSCIDISDRKEAEEALQKAHEELGELKNQLQAENIVLQEEIKLAQRVNEIIGESDALKYVLFKIGQVALTDSSVLILGETGTGKELVARAIHEQSKRKDRPLIKVNCAALSASLIESELFGHERGAFTGASARKIGRFELANGATLFLDEIGELPLELQSKLLRVLQEGELERLGGSQTIKVDVRIIAATNRNMKTALEKGTFREDLWYRLNVFPITVPPLRERKEDIPALVEHFVKGMAHSFGKSITSISSVAMKTLQDHSWPGNVRELANVIERAVINSQGSALRIVDQFEQSVASPRTLEEVEKEYITRILDETSWRVEGTNGAAKILGLNPSTLRTRMAKLGVLRRFHVAGGRNH